MSILKIAASVQEVSAVIWPKGDALAFCSSAPPPPYPKGGRCCSGAIKNPKPADFGLDLSSPTVKKAHLKYLDKQDPLGPGTL